eukprot:scaffold64978_cov18-Tisochrysis_lutea.AAC.2
MVKRVGLVNLQEQGTDIGAQEIVQSKACLPAGAKQGPSSMHLELEPGPTDIHTPSSIVLKEMQPKVHEHL